MILSTTDGDKYTLLAANNRPEWRPRAPMQQYNVGHPFERIAIEIDVQFPEPREGIIKSLKHCITPTRESNNMLCQTTVAESAANCTVYIFYTFSPMISCFESMINLKKLKYEHTTISRLQNVVGTAKLSDHSDHDYSSKLSSESGDHGNNVSAYYDSTLKHN